MHWLIVNGELVLYGYVGESDWDMPGFTSRDVMDALLYFSGDITVHINSGGGIAFEGIAIYNLLRQYAERTKGKVTVVVDAVALSTASLVAMAGDVVQMAPGSLLMLHDPSVGYYGNAEAQRAVADQLDKLADQCAAIYAAKAGITPEVARDLMRAETWYTAEEAVAAHFADELAAAGAATAEAAVFDYRLYGKSPSSLVSLATASASMFTPKAAKAAQPQETQMTLEQLIQMLAARFKTPAADVTVMCNQAIAAGIDLSTLVTMLKDDAVATMVAAKDAIRMKAAALMGVTPPPAPAPAPNPAPALAQMSATDIRDLQNRAATAGITLADLNAMMAVTGATKDTVSDAIINKVAEMAGKTTPSATAHVTEDERDKFREGASRALMLKVGLDKGERNEFSGLSLVEMARSSLVIAGIKEAARMDRMLMVGTAFTAAPTMIGGMHSTSDFAFILQNVASKSALKGFVEAPETFQLWTSKGQASDFKAAKRVDLGLFPSLLKVAEGAEYKYAKLSDRGVSIAIDTYGLMVAITRQAIINDDMSMLDKLPRKMGAGAKRTIGNLVYALLNANANLADGVALFHATHANLAGAGAAPSEGTIQAGITAMQKQKDADANAQALNITPRYFLSSAYQFTAKQLFESTGSLTDAKNAGVVNTVQGAATPITDQRITGNNWYLAADPNQVDTIEVTYLDGVEEPTLESQEGWKVDGTELKVRLDAAATVLDFRGLYKNAGA